MAEAAEASTGARRTCARETARTAEQHCREFHNASVHRGELDYAVERIVELCYAPQEGEIEERMDQDILLSILESADERTLFSVLIRLALAGHLEEPHGDQPDYLKQAASIFGVESARKKARKKTPAAKGKAARNSTKPKTKKGGAR